MSFFQNVIEKIKVVIRWVSMVIKRITKFITQDIWSLNTDDLSHRKARLVRDGKTVLLLLNTFSEQKMGFQITALAYQSMMAIVPLLAIGFFLTGGLGLSDKFADFIYSTLKDERMIDLLIRAADNILTTAASGLFGFISMLTFLWIVIWLMISVRRVFNNAWKVEQERNFWKMLGFVFGIIVLTPFVLILFFSGTVVYSNILNLLLPDDIAALQHLKSFLSWAIFAGVAVLILSVMYKYIPGTHVHYRHALKAALVSGIAFTVVQYLYLETQMLVGKQSAIYGVLAALPLFMLWLNLAWTLVIYGVELAYSFQNVDLQGTTSEQLDRQTQEAIQKRKQQNTIYFDSPTSKRP